MATNEVKLTIRVGDDGSLDVVAKKADKAAIAIEIIESEDFFSQLVSDEDTFKKISAVKGWNQSKNI